MRTTIELRDDQRAKLLALAARRAQKGFSCVIQEAIDLYLEQEGRSGEAIQRALKTQGSLTRREADELRSRTAAIRENWR